MVDGTIVQTGRASISFLNGLASVQEGARGLLACADPVSSTIQCVSVLENEQALLRWPAGASDKPLEVFVGSTAATTCVVVVLVDRTIGCAWVCHVVSPSVHPWLEEGLKRGGMVHPELFMAGGFRCYFICCCLLNRLLI